MTIKPDPIYPNKCFEFFTGFTLCKLVPPEVQKLKEFIIYDRDEGTFHLHNEGMDIEQDGTVDCWSITSETGYMNVTELCQAIQIRKELLISLN